MYFYNNLIIIIIIYLFWSIEINLYTLLINAYGINGQGKEALEVYHQMKQQSIPPNKMTFLSVLNACSYSGLVEEGIEVYDSMMTSSGDDNNNGIVPDASHECCMVDIFSRAGQLDTAIELAHVVNGIFLIIIFYDSYSIIILFVCVYLTCER